MGTIDDIGQKIKGEINQVKGDINQKRGKGLKGGLQKVKGKLEEAAADTKLNARRERQDADEDAW